MVPYFLSLTATILAYSSISEETTKHPWVVDHLLTEGSLERMYRIFVVTGCVDIIDTSINC